MEYVKEISLPIDKPYNRVPVFAKQGDYNSRFLHVTLTENDEAITTSAIGTVTRVAVGVARRKDRGSKCFTATYNTEWHIYASRNGYRKNNRNRRPAHSQYRIYWSGRE